MPAGFSAAPALRVIAMIAADAGNTAETTTSSGQRSAPSMNGVVASRKSSAPEEHRVDDDGELPERIRRLDVGRREVIPAVRDVAQDRIAEAEQRQRYQ